MYIKLHVVVECNIQVQILLISITAAAFKAGKIASNPFQAGTPGPGGVMIPPPSNMQGKISCNRLLSIGTKFYEF